MSSSNLHSIPHSVKNKSFSTFKGYSGQNSRETTKDYGYLNQSIDKQSSVNTAYKNVFERTQTRFGRSNSGSLDRQSADNMRTHSSSNPNRMLIQQNGIHHPDESAETTLHQIQALIIAQEIKGAHRSVLDMNNPENLQAQQLAIIKEHKLVQSQFQRKEYHQVNQLNNQINNVASQGGPKSLKMPFSQTFQKSKHQRNLSGQPMPLSPADKENMPVNQFRIPNRAVSQAKVKNTAFTRNQATTARFGSQRNSGDIKALKQLKKEKIRSVEGPVHSDIREYRKKLQNSFYSQIGIGQRAQSGMQQNRQSMDSRKYSSTQINKDDKPEDKQDLSLFEIVKLGKMRGDAVLPPSKKSKIKTLVNPRKIIAGNLVERDGCTSTRSQGNTKSVRYIFKDDEAKLRSRQATVPAFITEAAGPLLKPPVNKSNQMVRPSSEVSLQFEPAIIESVYGTANNLVVPSHNRLSSESIKPDQFPKKWVQLFKARQKDLKLSKNIEQQFERFTALIQEQNPEKLVLREQGFGSSSAIQLSKILKNNDSITSLDLSKNNLSANLDVFVAGLKENDRIVSLKLQNNNIDGRKYQQELFDLVWDHPSLTSVDIGNSDAIKNRNRLYNEGFIALVDGICESSESLISQLHLQSSCITSDGLSRLSKLTILERPVDIQILDLANNDLGSDAPLHLKPVFPSLIYLNLSNTKLGHRGAVNFAKFIKEADNERGSSLLQQLDISNNLIGASGFLKIMSRFKKSTSLTYLNVGGNDLSMSKEKFLNLEKFLATNKSCLSFNLSNCQLGRNELVFLASGIAKNTTLNKLILSENTGIKEDFTNNFVNALLNNKQSSLKELELQKCNLVDCDVSPFARLVGSNFKMRNLNLKDNDIRDKGANELLGALMANKYMTKLNIDLNPIRHQIKQDVLQQTKQNTLKVCEQEVPMILKEIGDVKKKTAESMLDCALDPLIRSKIEKLLPPEARRLLKKISKVKEPYNAQQKAFHNLKSIDFISKTDKKLLMREAMFHSYDVVNVISKLNTELKQVACDKKRTYEQFKNNDNLKEAIEEENLKLFKDLLQQKEECMDIKRELEFELIMLNEQSEQIDKREEKRLEDVRHKIEVIKMRQDQIKQEIKKQTSSRGMADHFQDEMRKKLQDELEKVEQQQSMTKIIHRTYVSELKRIKEKIQDEANRQILEIEQREKEEAQKAADAAAKANLETAKRGKVRKTSTLKKGGKTLFNTLKSKASHASKVKDKDVMGMNSPKKQKSPSKQWRLSPEKSVMAPDNQPFTINQKKTMTQTVMNKRDEDSGLPLPIKRGISSPTKIVPFKMDQEESNKDRSSLRQPTSKACSTGIVAGIGSVQSEEGMRQLKIKQSTGLTLDAQSEDTLTQDALTRGDFTSNGHHGQIVDTSPILRIKETDCAREDSQGSLMMDEPSRAGTSQLLRNYISADQTGLLKGAQPSSEGHFSDKMMFSSQ